jgi:DNA replication ATP-dependent helicase Dna2
VLCASGCAAESVGVISPYRSQVQLLQRLVGQPAVEVSTVDKFQGRDKDCIVLSLVRARPAGDADQGVGQLLRDWRRTNVAMTRAKKKLILVGSLATLRSAAVLGSCLELIVSKGWAVQLAGSVGSVRLRQPQAR